MSNKTKNYLIVGQGIAGTLFSYVLWKNKRDFLIVNSGTIPSSTSAAAGIMNPITGKFLALSWNYDKFFPAAVRVYHELMKDLHIDPSIDKAIVRALKDEKMLNEWQYRESQEQYSNFMTTHSMSEEELKLVGSYPGFGKTKYSFQVPIAQITKAWNQKMEADGFLINERFDLEDFQTVSDHTTYKDATFDHAIFCEGSHVVENPYFNFLPFDPAKGEVLLVKLPDWKADYIYKNQLFIAPWVDEGVFWVGSNYEWKTKDWGTSEEKQAWIYEQLRSSYHGRIEVVGKMAGIRPAIKDRKPVLGRHPRHKQIGIFNGLGTKGTSLGPLCAAMLFAHFEEGVDLPDELSVNRFPYPSDPIY